ncbi:hypothetical protein A4X13_0g7645 [Tilletia indica]|uniref:F-box protein Hrt3/FBXO9 C-terminal domain-containing protein n=1 Tax=Tilletia indica TaxID=43049 RepID=A0A177TFU0_9BASI|nr:hypothetical protein A4X13_0g7645 [Tilletia indica]
MGDEVETELQRFRAQWKQELLRGEQTSSSAPEQAEADDGPAAAAPATTNSDAYNALQAYTRAVLAERKHDLTTALSSYKRAFRLHDRPDKIYHRACALLLDNTISEKGKGKTTVLVHVEGVEIGSLLDEGLVALLRASLEPGTDEEGRTKGKAAVVTQSQTPRTSPVATIQPLPEVQSSSKEASRTEENGLSRAPLIPAENIAPPLPTPPAAASESRYITHAPTTTTSNAPHFTFNFPETKSTNTLLPILGRLTRDPRPDRESMLQRAQQASGGGVMTISSPKKKALTSLPHPEQQSQSQSRTRGVNAPLTFQPLDEDRPCPLARLPDELLLAIAVEVARPKGRRGEKLPLPIGLHSVPGAPVLGAGSGAGSSKHHQQDHHHHQQQHSSTTSTSNAHANTAGGTSSTSAPAVHNHPLGLAMNLALPDIPSLEALARTCTKWRVLTSGASLLGAGGERFGVWRLCVRSTLLPPLIPPLGPQQTDALLLALYKAHSSDWRTLYLEHPRLRMNGCYIAPCRYTRPGTSEHNVWISVVHVVEFYRSIRLFPDGSCLSLLSTEGPGETVRRMEGGWRRKGLCVGRWRLFPWGLPEEEGRNDRRRRRRVAGRGRRLDAGGEVEGDGEGEEDGLAQDVDNLLLEDAYADEGVPVNGAGAGVADDDDVFYEYDTEDEYEVLKNPPSSSSSSTTASNPAQPKLVLTDLRDRTLPKYAFRMVFNVKSTARGKWNRLELERYESIHLGNGERLGLPLVHTKPFVFSVVRSYGVG